MIWTVTNLKPGTGKTMSAVWLAHAAHEAGLDVLLNDADPGGARLALAPQWSDGLGSAGRWNEQARFPFDTISLASKDLHRALPPLAADHDLTVIDSPPIEDHQGIALSALRIADDIIIPVAPSRAELDRMAPMLDVLAEVETLRARRARVFVLLNRCVASAGSADKAHDALVDAGFTVLGARIPRLELYAQSHGEPVSAKETKYAEAAAELLAA